MEFDDINIMDIDVNNLKEKQYEYLKKHTIKILEDIIAELKNNELQVVMERLEVSPAGDSWGCENYFINFSYKEVDGAMDLAEILEKMAMLKGTKLILKHY